MRRSHRHSRCSGTAGWQKSRSKNKLLLLPSLPSLPLLLSQSCKLQQATIAAPVWASPGQEVEVGDEAGACCGAAFNFIHGDIGINEPKSNRPQCSVGTCNSNKIYPPSSSSSSSPPAAMHLWFSVCSLFSQKQKSKAYFMERCQSPNKQQYNQS